MKARTRVRKASRKSDPKRKWWVFVKAKPGRKMTKMPPGDAGLLTAKIVAYANYKKTHRTGKIKNKTVKK